MSCGLFWLSLWDPFWSLSYLSHQFRFILSKILQIMMDFFFLLVFVCLQSYSWYLFNGFWRGFFKLLKKQNQIKRVYKFYDQSLESLLCSYMFLFSVYNICGFPDLLLLRNNFSSICWSLEVDHLIPWNQLTWFVSNLVSD